MAVKCKSVFCEPPEDFPAASASVGTICRPLTCDTPEDFSVTTASSGVACVPLSCRTPPDFGVDDFTIPLFQNREVFKTLPPCPGDTIWEFTGDPPDWIIWEGSFLHRFSGAAGVFEAETQQLADILAKAALDAYVRKATADGELACSCADHFFELFWVYVTGDKVQTSAAEDGPWFDYIDFIPTVAQKKAKKALVQINNSFNGERWFRAVSAGGSTVKVTAFNPPACRVEMPVLAIANTSTSGTPLPIGDGSFIRPYSYIENPEFNPLPLYIEPVDPRMEVTIPFLAASVANTVTVVEAPVDATVTWTRNGSDPTADTVMETLDGSANNAAVHRNDFAGVVKGRAFRADGCKSAMCAYVVDKEYVQAPNTLVNSTNKSGSCDLPRDIGFGPEESGASCNVNYGGTDEFEAFMRQLACSTLAAATDGLFIVKNTIATSNRLILGWTAHVVEVGRMLFTSLNAPRQAAFDVRPVIYDHLRIKTSLTDEVRESIVSVSGPGQTFAEPVAFSNAYLAAFATGCLTEGIITLTRWNILSSVMDDYGTFTPGPVAPVPPVPPTPPGAPSAIIFGEDWEAYADGDAEAQTLNAGTGWLTNWLVTSVVLEDGYEHWTDYADGDAETMLLEGGEGWLTAWTISTVAIYGEDWQSYADGVAVSYTLDGGTGWLLLSTDPDVQTAWTIPDMTFLVGEEDWETYSDGVLTGTPPLADGEGWIVGAWNISPL